MPIILSDVKYTLIKELLQDLDLTKDEIAKKCFTSVTIVERVEQSKDYEDYVQRSTSSQFHSLNFDKKEVSIKNTPRKTEVVVKNRKVSNVKKAKKGLMAKIKGFFIKKC